MHAAHASAKAIRDGILLVEPIEEWSQVHRSSWESLAVINDLGLITYNSQDAIDQETGEVKTYERSYLEGFMLPERAQPFVEMVNMFSDKVAYRMGGTLDPTTSMAQTLLLPTIAVAKHQDEHGSWYTGMALKLDMKQRVIDRLKKEAQIPDEVPVTKVVVFDPKWGRTAISKNGLFKEVIKALTPGARNWAPNKLREERYQEWLSQGR